MSNSVITAVTTCNSVTTITTTTATVLQKQSVVGDTSSITHLFTSTNTSSNLTETPVKVQVVEQKIVTEKKTLTTTSAKVPMLLSNVKTAATQSLDDSESVPKTLEQSDLIAFEEQPMQQSDQCAISDANTVTEVGAPEVCDASSDDIISTPNLQPSVMDKENELTATVSTTDVPKSISDITLLNFFLSARDMKKNILDDKAIRPMSAKNTNCNNEREEDVYTAYSGPNALRKTQSEHSGRLADELKETLKEVVNTKICSINSRVATIKPPTKRLTEKQKEKLTASCEHLQMQDGYEPNTKGGSISQLLAASGMGPRYELRRKLSSISEKSAEIINGADEVNLPAPSSVSCPTTTRISKDHKRLPRTLQNYRDNTHYGVRQSVFAELKVPLRAKLKIEDQSLATSTANGAIISPKLQGTHSIFQIVNTTSEIKWNKWIPNGKNVKLKNKISDESGNFYQRSIAVVDARPPWNSSPLKDGELDRIAPLQPVISRHFYQRKWLSASHLDHSPYDNMKCESENIRGRRQSDWNLDIKQTRSRSAARVHTRVPLAVMLRNSSYVKWTPNGTGDHRKPVKERLWWS
ncbi:unnamed protein product [Thelazia callipaeda]|uniref:Polycomb protein Asx n=1 Tax=Thelazia callipaeda TaxID=103827 RepID=A0A0N5CXZ3_THECL|nr:unnamed protein product [Thelazia callipaeda]